MTLRTCRFTSIEGRYSNTHVPNEIPMIYVSICESQLKAPLVWKELLKELLKW